MCPDVFAEKMITLYIKVVAYVDERINWKGGRLVECYKNKGPACMRSSYRGLLVSDQLGKLLHRAMRRRLTGSYIGQRRWSQQGGAPGCSTAHANFIVRLFQEWTAARKRSSAVLYVDIASAFYAVLRELVMNLDTSDQAIAWLMQQLNIPPQAFSDLERELQQPCVFDSVGVGRTCN